MSAISLKSITGITSITTPAGVDNQLTLHNNNTSEAVKLDGAGNLHFHNHLNITGVSTASNFKTGTSNLHNTGLNVFDLDVDGHTNLDNVSIAGVTTVANTLKFNDSVYARFGTDGDANLWHDNSHLRFNSGTGNFNIQSNDFQITDSSNTTLRFRVDADGATYIRHNGLDRLITTNAGVSFPQDIDVDGHTNLDNVSIVGVTTFNGLSSNDVIRVRSADSNGNCVVNILSEGTTGNSRILFSDTAATSGDGWISYSHNDRAITFTTAGTSNERLRINSSGNIGINENLPGHKLTIGGDGYFGFTTPTDAARQIIFNANRGSAGQTLANINWQWNSKNVAQIRGMAGADTSNKDDGHLTFYTSAANNLVERLRITSDGKFGFNDSDPERTVDIKGSNCMVQLEGTAGSGRQYSLCSTDNATGTAVDGGPSGTFAIYDDTAGQARLRIDSNGNTRFLVTGGSFTAEGTGAYGISIHNSNSPSMGHLFIYGDNGLIRFRNNSNTYTAQMGYTESNNTLFFANQEGGTTMYITGDGVKLYDNNKFLCGNDNDLGIYHDNSNAYIENTSGSIFFRHSGSNKVEMKSAGGIKFHNQASGNFIQYSNSTVAPNAAINLQRYGNGYCDMRLSSNYGAKVMLAGASDNTDEFVMQQGNTKEAYINNEATGKHINIQIGGTTKLQIGDDEESVRVSGTSADHTGTTGGSKGLTLQYGGGYSVPLYFGNETDSAQKSMYLHGYWIYLRGHQNEGVRFVFSQGAGNAIRSEKFQFKYNSCLNSTNSTTWNTSSDARAKENVQTITNGIEIIKKLRPVTYDWTNDFADSQTMYIMGRDENGGTVAKKENGYDTDRKNGQMGFIAQEYETVLPKDVMKDTYKLGETELDDFRTMTNDSLLPSLTAALKEAIAKIEDLEAKVAALEGS